MNRHQQRNEQDPLGLRDLPLLTPDADGWPAIALALEQSRRRQQHWKKAGGWMALAAGLVLVVGIALKQRGLQPANTVPVEPDSATQLAASSSSEQESQVESLIVMSQVLEQRLRGIREQSGTMPAESAVYVAELEDLVAQVDHELSYNPGSVNLWGQRVNLLLDLALIYQQQWEREYGRMVSR